MKVVESKFDFFLKVFIITNAGLKTRNSPSSGQSSSDISREGGRGGGSYPYGFPRWGPTIKPREENETLYHTVQNVIIPVKFHDEKD